MSIYPLALAGLSMGVAGMASATSATAAATGVWVLLCGVQGRWLVDVQTGRRIPASPEEGSAKPCHGILCRREDEGLSHQIGI